MKLTSTQTLEPVITTTTIESKVSTTEESVSLEPDCDFVQYEQEGYYASRDLMIRVQKPIGVCHTDAGISGVNSSMILSCKVDGSGVEIEYYNNQQCLGTPSDTGTLSQLMTSLG